VADIYCNACDTRLGWKYVEAFEESQKYLLLATYYLLLTTYY